MTGSRLEEMVRSLSPESVLDVGCGCGTHIASILPQDCARVIAIDAVSYASKWQALMRTRRISFCQMDATALGFVDDSFPLVLERDLLHHIARWPDALSEMLRVSSNHVLLQEPVDELRSPAKQRAYEAQGLFLELQAEVGFPHYLHLKPKTLLSAVRSQAQVLDVRVDRCDNPISFDEFFESYSDFALQSGRKEYWLGRMEEMRARFNGEALCDDDRLTVLVAGSGSRSRA